MAIFCATFLVADKALDSSVSMDVVTATVVLIPAEPIPANFQQK